jgi:recombination protein RecA
MIRRAPIAGEPLSAQVANRLSRRSESTAAKADDRVISTGSTLLDLAISGGRYPEGGIPGGILVEVFGPSGCGKTVLLCEIAGAVQRQKGEVKFNDPEGRLNRQFAALFGYKYDDADYSRPDTVSELFSPVRSWEPRSNGSINGIFADSLAALSTEMEMGDEDKMGMRRAKEFSEECRKTCRVLANRGFLMVCSNQVRQNPDAGKFGQRYRTPGGEAVPFYASLRLRCHSPEKTTRTIKIGEEKHKRVVGVHTTFEVYKSSIDVPYRCVPGSTGVPVHIVFDYGIDDIRANLEFVKSVAGPPGSHYSVDGERRLGAGIESSIRTVEEDGLEPDLKRRTIQLWHELGEKFRVERRAKRRE